MLGFKVPSVINIQFRQIWVTPNRQTNKTLFNYHCRHFTFLQFHSIAKGNLLSPKSAFLFSRQSVSVWGERKVCFSVGGAV